MHLPVEWGTVPAFIEAGGVWAAVLFQGVQSSRRELAESFPRLVEEISDLEPEEIQAVLAEHPAIAQLVGDAWEIAARSAAYDKRWLLARVAAAALLGPDDAEIEQLPFFL